MAWELAYTSVARGPTGRSGFQFVATSPGTPPGVTRLVTPYMTYRPPPGAPAAPTDEELAAFPTALAYGRQGGYLVLARCRYTGRDYSGRYGNFLGRALVATPEEMEGLRPIEFWHAPIWDRPPGGDQGVVADGGPWHGARPATATDAPAPTASLTPGAAFDPDALVAWLAREHEHDRLAALLDAVAGVLTGGHGRVVLVSADAERIARWIALVSYSLPAELAADLSFTTYTDAPETAAQVLVGTVPAAWPRGGFRLDEPAGTARPGRFARVLTGCWRRGDLDGIDAVGECLLPGVSSGGDPPDDTRPHPAHRPYGTSGTGDAVPTRTADGTRTPRDLRPQGGAYEGAPPARNDAHGGTPEAPATVTHDDPARRGGAREPAGVPSPPGDAAPVPHAAGRRGPSDTLMRDAGNRPDAARPDTARLDAAAALLALCRADDPGSADDPVSEEEQAGAAALVRERGAPSWVWPAISPALPSVGFELAAALAGTAPAIDERCVALALADPARARRLPRLRLRDGLPGRFRAAVAAAPDLPALAGVLALAERVGGAVESGDVTAAAAACARRGAGAVAEALRTAPEPWREALVAGVLAGLKAAEPPVRRAMLTPEACAALGDHDWSRAPCTGGLVPAARPDRLEATAGLVRLEPYGLPELTDLLAALWDAPPSIAECRRLVERMPEAILRFGPLRAVTRRVFDDAPVDAEETVRLAALIRERLPVLAGPARTVLACDAALRAGTAEEIARALGTMAADGPPAARARAAVARALRGRSPTYRARVLAAVPAAVRDDVTGHWVAAGPGRREAVDLAEIEARLAAAEVSSAPLRAWADGLGRFARRRVESALTERDPGLAAAWRSRRREA